MRIEGNYLVLDNEILKSQKITAHQFTDLLGLNRFNPIGDTLLKMFNLASEDNLNDLYIKRGECAEVIVKKSYTKKGHNCTTYDKKEIKYDNFQDNSNFKGIIDIELLEEKKIIEVKSKNLKKYDEILDKQPLNEIYQALLYGYLRDYEKVIVEWVFFDDKTEEEIINGQKITCLANLKHIAKEYIVDKKIMKQLEEQVINIVDDFIKTRKISLSLISDNMLKKLNLVNDYGINDSDLPFWE